MKRRRQVLADWMKLGGVLPGGAWIQFARARLLTGKATKPSRSCCLLALIGNFEAGNAMMMLMIMMMMTGARARHPSRPRRL